MQHTLLLWLYLRHFCECVHKIQQIMSHTLDFMGRRWERLGKKCYICRGLNYLRMKKILILLAAVFTFSSLRAENSISETLAPIEGSYIEQMMAANYFADSQMSNRDFLITSFLMENQKRFYPADLILLKDTLYQLSDKELLALSTTNFKNPTVSVILSVLVGGYGVDRFYIGDIGLGVAKLLTGGGLGVWYIVDIFLISNKTKKNNNKDLQETLMLNEVLLAR